MIDVTNGNALATPPLSTKVKMLRSSGLNPSMITPLPAELGTGFSEAPDSEPDLKLSPVKNRSSVASEPVTASAATLVALISEFCRN